MALIFGGISRCGDSASLLRKTEELTKEYGIEIQLLNADLVFGSIHLEVAVEKAERSFEDQRNISRNLATELLLYASAETQISNAIEKIGIKDGIRNVAVVVWGDCEINNILENLDLARDDSVLVGNPNVTNLFGIDSQDGKGDEEHITRLIIEKIALSELRR
jgi:tRNA threonylcarbamoyladenosine modification (KEOPS) complex Cgi121 subunit